MWSSPLKSWGLKIISMVPMKDQVRAREHLRILMSGISADGSFSGRCCQLVFSG
jgi:hypothetical protein